MQSVLHTAFLEDRAHSEKKQLQIQDSFSRALVLCKMTLYLCPRGVLFFQNYFNPFCHE